MSTTATPKTRRSEEEIVADMERSLRRRKAKLVLRETRKNSAYLRRLEAAKRAIDALRLEPDWPADPWSEKLVEAINTEIGSFVNEGNV
jgi:hypothetical protein